MLKSENERANILVFLSYDHEIQVVIYLWVLNKHTNKLINQFGIFFETLTFYPGPPPKPTLKRTYLPFLFFFNFVIFCQHVKTTIMMKMNWWHDLGDYCGDYVTLSKYTLDYWYIFMYTFRILLIIEYIRRKWFSFRLSVTFGKPLSRKLLKNLLPKGKISNATIWSHIEAMKCPSTCRFGWLLSVSRTAKDSP